MVCERSESQKDRIGEAGKEAGRGDQTRPRTSFKRSVGKNPDPEAHHGRRPSRRAANDFGDSKRPSPKDGDSGSSKAPQAAPRRQAHKAPLKPPKALLEPLRPVQGTLHKATLKAAQKAKRIALGQEKRKAILGDETLLPKIKEMAYAYEAVLGEYVHNHRLRFIKGSISPEHRSFAQFKRAVLIADQIGVSYETYVRAQFYWFDKWFNRAPHPYELSGLKSKFPAPERVRKYLQLVNEGQTKGIVTCIGKRVQIDAKELDKANDQRLDQLMLAWGLDEEGVLLRFARSGVGYFDHEWLKKNPTWQRLRQEKKL